MKKTLRVLAAVLALMMLVGMAGCIDGEWDEAEADQSARELLEAFVGAIEGYDVDTIDFMLADGFQLEIYEGFVHTQTKSRAQLMGELNADETYQLTLRSEGYVMDLATTELLCNVEPDALLTMPEYEQDFAVEELAVMLGLDPVWVSDTGNMKFTLVWDASGEYKIYLMEIFFDANPMEPVPED
mgnify:CR=1 FL=1